MFTLKSLKARAAHKMVAAQTQKTFKVDLYKLTSEFVLIDTFGSLQKNRQDNLYVLVNTDRYLNQRKAWQKPMATSLNMPNPLFEY